MQKITYDLFEKTYKPVKNHLDDECDYDLIMFETYGNEHQFILDTLANPETNKCVWTVIGEHDETELASGYHIENRLGYIVTEIPLADDCDMFVYDPDLIVLW